MEKEKNFGFLKLTRKSFAILAASLSSLLSNQSKGEPYLPNVDNADKNINYETFQRNFLNTTLVLKLNVNKFDSAFTPGHTSHSSHSSHASSSPSPGHSSHASHASHMSSSPGYPSTTTTPKYKPKILLENKPRPVYIEPKLKSSTTTLPFYILGSRVLFKGCKGSDVEELQNLLIKLGYKVSANGYFDEATEVAVKNFQTENELKVNGKVGKSTLLIMQSK